MKKIVPVFLCLILLFTALITSCGEPDATPPKDSGITDTGITETTEPTAVSSEKTRNTDVQILDSELDKVVEGNGEFAFDLYHTLNNQENNLFFSPHSISLALAMTYAGAREETEAEMAEVLHFTLPQTELHKTLNGLDLLLSGRGNNGETFELNIANAIWGQDGYTFLPAYLDTLAENYGTGLQTLDFINKPEAAGATINQWVEENTNGRIKNIITPDTIDAYTRLILANAIYFKADWQSKFRAEATIDRAFTLLDGTNVTIPMMRQEQDFGYTEGDGYQAVELSYKGNEISMVIILPEADRFESFTNTLDYSTFSGIIADVSTKNVNLAMPKFEFESDLNIKTALENMGMTEAFGENADFSSMNGGYDLFIDEVKHKAFVLVDETGTEAAAATVVDVSTECMRETTYMTVDHPFIFLIRDIGTGEILFLGNVMNPAE